MAWCDVRPTPSPFILSLAPRSPRSRGRRSVEFAWRGAKRGSISPMKQTRDTSARLEPRLFCRLAPSPCGPLSPLAEGSHAARPDPRFLSGVASEEPQGFGICGIDLLQSPQNGLRFRGLSHSQQELGVVQVRCDVLGIERQ